MDSQSGVQGSGFRVQDTEVQLWFPGSAWGPDFAKLPFARGGERNFAQSAFQSRPWEQGKEKDSER
jgi:hypothetical protein